MTLVERIDKDLKTALLGGDKLKVITLRSLKNALLYARVASKDHTLSDDDILDTLSKEAKKRQESADIYLQAHEDERAASELREKQIIEEYLPAQLSAEEIEKIIEKTVAALPDKEKNIGHVIAQVKSETRGAADGAIIARLVKERLGR